MSDRGRAAALALGAGRRGVAAGEQLVEDRHPHHQAGGDLLGDQRLRRVDRLAGELDAAVDRAGVHQQLARVEAAAVDLEAGGVLAQRGDEALAHPLLLHPQRVDDVGLLDPVEAVGDLAAELLDPARDQGRRAADGDLGAHRREGDQVGAGDAAVEDVADDPDPGAVERAEAAAQRVDVEQRLARVLVLAVAGVDDRGRGPAGDHLGGARVGVADDDRGGVVGGERRDRVLQRLALLDRGAGGLDRDEVGGEALGGEVEGARGAGARLVEERDDGAAAQGRHLLDVAAADLGEALGAIEDRLDFLARELLDREQVLHRLTSIGARLGDRHPVCAVDLLEADVDPLLAGGRQVLADVVGADRQLAVAAVAEDRQLHPLRTAVVEERLDRGADGAAGVEDVVDEDDRALAEVEVDVGGVDDGLRAGCLGADVVAVEGDVEVADRQVAAGQLTEEDVEAAGQDGAASVDADDRQALGIGVLLGDLVGDPPQRSPQIVVLQHDLLVHFGCFLPGLAGPG